MRNSIIFSIKLIFLITLFYGANASAKNSDLQCGIYISEDSRTQLTVLNNRQIKMDPNYSTSLSLEYTVNNNTLNAYNISLGFSSKFTIENKGQEIKDEYVSNYSLVEKNDCEVLAPPPADSCRADLQTCSDNSSEASIETLEAWCDEGLPFICSRLIAAYIKEEKEKLPKKSNTSSIIPDEEPLVCRERTADYDAKQCREIIEKITAELLLNNLSDLIVSTSEPLVLSEARLDKLLSLCKKTNSVEFCDETANVLWDSERYEDAIDALTMGCQIEPKEANYVCDKVENLKSLSALSLPIKTRVADVLPCGMFKAENSLISELNFLDNGLVEMGFSGKSRARLENGKIYIRHDKGGDFIFSPVGDKYLIGRDFWSRFAIFTQDTENSPASCKAPITFIETPLVEDCPLSGKESPKQCCDRGSFQGCNMVGNQLVLNNEFEKALPYYEKICKAGVRVGCENMTTLYSKGVSDSKERLEKICASQTNHIACDVNEITNWELLNLGQELEKTLQNIKE